MSIKSCHVCHSTNLTSWCPGLLECGSCTHVQADMELSDSDLAELYGHKYFHGEEYVDYSQERAALQLNFKYRLKEMQNLAPDAKRLFEIGCAYGYFLEYAASRYEVAGCDISDHAIRIAQDAGLNAQAIDYLTLEPPSEAYDIVCMWDTIEHIGQPRPYVEKAFTELNAGGCLVITTGDAGSWVARQRRHKWRMVHPPTHLHYFTSGSMKQMLINAGFSRVEISHNPFYRNVGTSLEKVGQLSENSLVKMASKAGKMVPVIPKLNVPINLYDIMTACAWK